MADVETTPGAAPAASAAPAAPDTASQASPATAPDTQAQPPAPAPPPRQAPDWINETVRGHLERFAPQKFQPPQQSRAEEFLARLVEQARQGAPQQAPPQADPFANTLLDESSAAAVRAEIDRRVAARTQEIDQKLQQYTQGIRTAQEEREFQAVQSEADHTAVALNHAYQAIYHQDREYCSDTNLAKIVDDMVQHETRKALTAARAAGDFSGLAALRTPERHKFMLYMAKQAMAYNRNLPRAMNQPAMPAGAHLESSTSGPPANGNGSLSAEEIEILRKAGIPEAEYYAAAKAMGRM